jgi:phosphomannomutase
MLTALLVLDVLARSDRKLSDIVVPLFTHYFISGELNFRVGNTSAVIDAFRSHFKNASKVYELDGLSVEESDWHFNLRPSNTEPLLRLNAEALSKGLLEQKVGELTKLIEEAV